MLRRLDDTALEAVEADQIRDLALLAHDVGPDDAVLCRLGLVHEPVLDLVACEFLREVEALQIA